MGNILRRAVKHCAVIWGEEQKCVCRGNNTSEESLTQCVALVFYPDDQTDWEDFQPCFLEVIEKIIENQKIDKVSVREFEGKYQEYYAWQRMVSIDAEKALPPVELNFFNGQECIISAKTEYWWLTGGGTSLFYDSYTIKFQTSSKICSLIQDFFLTTCQKYGISVEQKIAVLQTIATKNSLLKRILLHSFWSILCVIILSHC